jgi:hypothetical protein
VVSCSITNADFISSSTVLVRNTHQIVERFKSLIVVSAEMKAILTIKVINLYCFLCLWIWCSTLLASAHLLDAHVGLGSVLFPMVG